MFRNFFGNEGQINHVTSAIAEGRLSHAYIIEGDEGSGKLTFARATSALLAGSKSSLEAEKILSGKSPDVTEYDVPEKKKFITIDTIRQIKYDANIKPNELDVRIFIINHAEAINTAGQNALLKLLEEPPKGVYFFLLCENSSSLLPTVRSRAQCIRMERFSEKKIAKYLESLGKYDKDSILLAALSSGGSIGRALDTLKTEKKDKNDTVKELIEILYEGDFTKVITKVSSLPSDRAECSEYLVNLQKAIRDMICVCSGSKEISYFQSYLEAQSCAAHFDTKKLISLYECVSASNRDINLNMNVQTLKICLAKRMMRALCR